MKVLLTDKGLTCKHPNMTCGECGSVVYKEKPGRKRSIESFLRLMTRMKKVADEEAKQYTAQQVKEQL